MFRGGAVTRTLICTCVVLVVFAPAVVPLNDFQDISPDHSAQEEVTTGLSLFAGGFKEGGRT